jgi:hypothetical protein
MLTAKIGAAIAAVALYYWGVCAVHQAGYDKAVAKYTKQALRAEEDARTKESQLNQKVIEAQNAAVIRGQEIKKLSEALALSSIKLRNTTATIRSNLSTNSCETNRNTADTAITVFEECRAEYSKMAENATGHASDFKTLDDAWYK